MVFPFGYSLSLTFTGTKGERYRRTKSTNPHHELVEDHLQTRFDHFLPPVHKLAPSSILV